SWPVTVQVASGPVTTSAVAARKPAGSVSRSVTAVASAGPALSTTSRQVAEAPAVPVLGVTVLATPRSAARTTGTTDVEVSFAGTGSGVCDDPAAVLTTSPVSIPDATATCSATPKPAPGARPSMRQVTRASVTSQVTASSSGVAATTVVPAGSSSTSSTSTAVDGPALVTASM